MWLAGTRGEGHGKLMFNGHTVSAWEEETVLEMDGGDGYTVM